MHIISRLYWAIDPPLTVDPYRVLAGKGSKRSRYKSSRSLSTAIHPELFIVIDPLTLKFLCLPPALSLSLSRSLTLSPLSPGLSVSFAQCLFLSLCLFVSLSGSAGLWFDLEISYSGSFLMTLETKMNLARLGKESEGLGEPGKDG